MTAFAAFPADLLVVAIRRELLHLRHSSAGGLYVQNAGFD
jgi:hypothetical protein